MSVEINSISFKDLSFQFNEEHVVLNNASFEFPVNKVIRFHGPHGSGKSTILRLLASLLEPDQGHYSINGEAVNEMSFEELIPYRLKIGYGFDYGGLINNRTIYQNLMLPIQYHKVMSEQEAHEHVMSMIEKFGLTRSAKYRPSAVSGGQRKLGCVVRSLILKPELLILDEPAHGLNERSIETLCDYIAKGREDGWLKHVFLTTENKTIIEGIVDKDIILQDQKIIDFDSIFEDTIKGSDVA